MRTHGLKTENQSLDSMSNPSGAPGSSYDLSMDGSPARRRTGEPMDSLYQAPAEAETGAAAPGAPVAGAASASFADALKEVSRKGAAASAGGAVPQKAFTTPKGNFGALSGTSGGGGGSGASWSPGGVSQKMFGANVAKTAVVAAHGLGSGDAGAGTGGKPILSSLKGAASQGQAALATRSADLSRAVSGTNFDGSRGGAAVGDGAALGGAYSGLDGVAANLKPNPVPDTLPTNPVPGQVAGAMSQSQQMQQAITMMVATAVVGGLVSGVCGMVFGTSTSGASSALIKQMAKQIADQNKVPNLN